MPNHKTKLIVNPNADLGRAWRTAGDLRPVIEELGGADWAGTVYPTHAIELARQAADEGYELVVAVGGDGTVHEVVNGLMQSNALPRPRLGVVPLGSGNDFSHAIGLPKNPVEALRRVMGGQPRWTDLGYLRGTHGRAEYWDNAVGIGFDATVTVRTRRVRFFSGFPVFMIAVLQTILLNHDAMHLKITCDGKTWEDDLLLHVMCNGGREGGGFNVSPHSRPDDGSLDYMSVRKVNRLQMMRILPEVMKGTHLKLSDVSSGKFIRMDVESDRPMYVHTDGEIFAGFGVDLRQLSVEIHPNALEVMA